MPDDPRGARRAPGYYRVGANRDMLFKVEDLNRIEKLTDYVDTTSAVFLGLTVGCARCHDHKFDPIPAARFLPHAGDLRARGQRRVFLEYNPARFYDLAANTRDFKLRQIGDRLERIFKPVSRAAARRARWRRSPEEVQAALRIPRRQAHAAQQALVTGVRRHRSR